jgi:hypothetical protein
LELIAADSTRTGGVSGHSASDLIAENGSRNSRGRWRACCSRRCIKEWLLVTVMLALLGYTEYGVYHWFCRSDWLCSSDLFFMKCRRSHCHHPVLSHIRYVIGYSQDTRLVCPDRYVQYVLHFIPCCVEVSNPDHQERCHVGATGREQYITDADLEDIKYPHESSTVPSWSVPVITMLSPPIFLHAHGAVVQLPTAIRHYATLGGLFSTTLSALSTNVFKLTVRFPITSC